jgi:hypothetical protein
MTVGQVQREHGTIEMAFHLESYKRNDVNEPVDTNDEPISIRVASRQQRVQGRSGRIAISERQ